MYDELIGELYLTASTARSKSKRELLEKAADAIKNLICEVADEHNARLDAEERQRWIPSAERLPGGRDSVLALTGDCDIYVCDYIPSVKQFWTIPGDELHIDDITHWMPLPEPPEEE